MSIGRIVILPNSKISGDCLWADSTFSLTRTKYIYLAERVQNISIIDIFCTCSAKRAVDIFCMRSAKRAVDIFCTRSAKRAVGSRAVTQNFRNYIMSNVILSNRYLAEHHFPDTSFSRKLFYPNRHVAECLFFESSFSRTLFFRIFV